jgi:hypothetical protein
LFEKRREIRREYVEDTTKDLSVLAQSPCAIRSGKRLVANDMSRQTPSALLAAMSASTGAEHPIMRMPALCIVPEPTIASVTFRDGRVRSGTKFHKLDGIMRCGLMAGVVES